MVQTDNILMSDALSLMEAFEKAVNQFENKNEAEFSNVYPDQADAVALEEREEEQSLRACILLSMNKKKGTITD